MEKVLSWRALLNSIIDNSAERERIANEIGVRPITLARWASGESMPRPQNLGHLLNSLPKRYREQFQELLEEDFPHLFLSGEDNSTDEIAFTFISQVLDTRANTPDMLRFWTMTRLILQHALQQLDSNTLGMSITLVRCMPPTRDGKIRSLRESVGLGTPPWSGDLEQRALFLGAESLAGHVVTLCRPETIDDMRINVSFLPAYQTEYEVSATAHPIMYANRIAGCLLLSSTQPRYFLSLSRFSLIRGYTNLLALAFNAEEFYAPELVELYMMPPLEVQQTYFAHFRQRVLALLKESSTTQYPLTSVQAEQVVWQQLEEQFLEQQQKLSLENGTS
jgi:transcriptional regulator with XRE-family HTH domain